MRKPTNCFVHSLFEPHRDAAALQATQQTSSGPDDDDYATGRASPSAEGLKSEKVADKNPDAATAYSNNVNQNGALIAGGGGVETAVQSRLLTKKQISDMAFGIRELAKKLAHIRIKMNVRNVFILAKAHDETLIGKTREMAEWLLKQDVNYRM